MPWSQSKERINKNRKKLLEYKQTLQCKKCGLDDHRVLEFHHVGDKDNNISSMVNHGYAWKRVEEEINKCIPLCCNCHRLEHWEQKVSSLETNTPSCRHTALTSCESTSPSPVYPFCQGDIFRVLL